VPNEGQEKVKISKKKPTKNGQHQEKNPKFDSPKPKKGNKSTQKTPGHSRQNSNGGGSQPNLQEPLLPRYWLESRFKKK